MIIINYRTHRLGGLVVGLVATSVMYPSFEFAPTALITFSSYLGSYVPDIDEPNSMIGKKVPLLSRTIKRFLRHRGAVHTPACCLILLVIMRFGLAQFIEPEYLKCILIGFGFGYLSHLLLDTITSKGIMWLWPITNKYISTQSEVFVKVLILVSAGAYFYCKYDLFDWILNALKI